MKTHPLHEPRAHLASLPAGPAIPPNGERIRVAVFGSFLGGFHVLRGLLIGPLATRVEVVGVATDNPRRVYTHPKVRLWKYPHSRDDELLVPRLARVLRLPMFRGRIRSPEFSRLFAENWRPDLCLMATFGQKIPDALIEFPRLGFYNFHHSGAMWPSYPGPDPIAAMHRDGRKHLVLTLHKVTSVIDGGEFVARSHPVPIPAGVNAVEMHRITWPQMGDFIRDEVGALLLAGDRPPGWPPILMRETSGSTSHHSSGNGVTGRVGTPRRIDDRTQGSDCTGFLNDRRTSILRTVQSGAQREAPWA
ncbi:MAG: formyltransferase family protein [Limisphaerales bacterium]